eukprot:scaffold9110_cov52-Phaeocystis_antarctica.AAC.2
MAATTLARRARKRSSGGGDARRKKKAPPVSMFLTLTPLNMGRSLLQLQALLSDLVALLNEAISVGRGSDVERGGAAAGASGGADAALGRQQVGLLRRVPPHHRQGQALPGTGEQRRPQGHAPGLLRHRRGGGAVRRANAGGAGGGREGCSCGGAADERGGAAAGAGGGADAACGRYQDGLLRRVPPA